MRVKFIIALAIASVVLLVSAGIALAADTSTCVPCSTGGISGIPTAEQLTAGANNEINNFGFPDLSGIEAIDTTDFGAVEGLDDVGLESPICGVCGTIPEATCNEKTVVVPGPQVNLGCPLITTFPVPVTLSAGFTPSFPSINIAPQFCLGLPQVTTNLQCTDIACQPVTNINSCPVCAVPC